MTISEFGVFVLGFVCFKLSGVCFPKPQISRKLHKHKGNLIKSTAASGLLKTFLILFIYKVFLLLDYFPWMEQEESLEQADGLRGNLQTKISGVMDYTWLLRAHSAGGI